MQNLKNIFRHSSRSGFVMLFAVFLSVAILSLTMGVLNVSLKEVNFSSSGRDTNDASLAADLGVECALFNDKSTANKFPIPYAVTTMNKCVGITPTLTGASTGANSVSYDFILPGIGANGNGCAKVNVSKDSSVPQTIIISKGYNIGNSSCNSSNPNRLEREYEVRIGGVLTPPTPPPAPGNKALFSSFTGSGSGTISASPSGSSCGTDCLSFSNGTAITLTANPGASSVFTGWGGDCSGMSCVLTMDQDRFVTANFDATVVTSNFPTVAGTNSSTQTSDLTSHTVALPASISAGDLLIVLAEFDGNPTITWPGGWNQLFVDSASTTDRLEGRYRVATGTEGASIPLTTSSAEKSAHQSFRITDYTGNPVVATAKGSATRYPDSPNLTPWGGASKDTLWISAIGRGAGTNVSTTAYPTNYTNGTSTQTGADATGGSLDTARRNLASSSENPGSFTVSANQVWVGATIAVQGGTVSPPPTMTYVVSGVVSGANGTITPASQTVNSGNTATLTVTPNSGYTASASGCGGSLAGTTYTTGTINGDCTVTATFTAPSSITLDSISNSGALAVTPVPSPVTWNHTIGSGSNRILVVTTAGRNTVNSEPTAVTFNGTALTKIRGDFTLPVTTSMWYLVNPPVGTYPIRVTVNANHFQANGISLFGVNQTTPVNVHNGATGASVGPISASLTTTVPNTYIIDVATRRTTASETITMTSFTNRVQRTNSLTAAGGIRTGVSTVGLATAINTYVMEWTSAALNGWTISAAAFRP